MFADQNIDMNMAWADDNCDSDWSTPAQPAISWDWITALLDDHGMVLVHTYASAIHEAVRCLENHEPTVRTAAVRVLASATLSAVRWANSPPAFLAITNALFDIFTADEIQENRDTAAIALARMVPLATSTYGLGQSSVIDADATAVQPSLVPLSWLSHTFLLAFAQLTDMFGNVPIAKLPTRISILAARSAGPLVAMTAFPLLARIQLVTAYLPVLPTIDPAANNILHAIFALLLRPEVIEPVSAGVASALTAHLPKSNSDRTLANTVYRPLMLALLLLPEPAAAFNNHTMGTSMSTDVPRASERRVTLNSSGMSSSAARHNLTYTPHSKQAISRFLAEWYPVPLDSVIQALPDSMFTGPAAAKEGYVVRRRRWLTMMQRFTAARAMYQPLDASLKDKHIWDVLLRPDIRANAFPDPEIMALRNYDTFRLRRAVLEVLTVANASMDAAATAVARALSPQGIAEAAMRQLSNDVATSHPDVVTAADAIVQVSRAASAALAAARASAKPTTGSPTSGSPLGAVVAEDEELPGRRKSLAVKLVRMGQTDEGGDRDPDLDLEQTDSPEDLGAPPIPEQIPTRMTLAVHSENPVWEPDILSLSIPHGHTLQFLRRPYVRTIYITSKSPTHATPFHVQVWPKQFFRVHPASGVVPAMGVIPILIGFDAKPCANRPVQEIDGFIRVRDRFGFPVCRFPLRGTILPSVHCPAKDLDFGLCTPGETRTMILPMHNMTNTECNCSIQLSHASPFSVLPPHFILQPKEQKIVKVRFTPSAQSSIDTYKGVLHLSTDAGEKYAVSLQGVARTSLVVHTMKLDYGLVDMTWSPAIKPLIVENLSSAVLPVTLIPSTRELVVLRDETLEQKRLRLLHPALNQDARGQKNLLTLASSEHDTDAALSGQFTVELQPYEKRRIPLSLAVAMHGKRSERVLVTAPFAAPALVEVSAQSGCPVYAPVHSEIFMMPCRLGTSITDDTADDDDNDAPNGGGKGSKASKTCITIPIVNAQVGPVLVFIETPTDLTLRLLEVRAFNTESVHIDLTPSFGSPHGVFLQFSGMGTAPLEIEFVPTLPGRWVFRLGVYMCKTPTPRQSDVPPVATAQAGSKNTNKEAPPVDFSAARKTQISTHLIYAMALSPGYLARENVVKDLRQVLSMAAPTSLPESAPGTAMSDTTAPRVAAAVFDIDPPSLCLHGTHKLGRFLCQGTISLSNVTHARQNYHLVAPPWVQLSVPLDGSIPALSALDVPITIEIPLRLATPEALHHLFAGFVMVLDGKSPRGAAMTEIRAVIEHPVHLQVRSDLPVIQFPATKVLNKVSRKIPIRNCLPVEGVWEGRIFLTEIQNRSIVSKSNEMLNSSLGTTINANANSAAATPAAGGGRAKKSVTMGAAPVDTVGDMGEGEEDVRNPFSLLVYKLVLKPYAISHIEVMLQATGTGRFCAQLEYEIYAVQKYTTQVPRFAFTLGFECDVGKIEPCVPGDAILFSDTDLFQPSEYLMQMENPQMLVAPVHAYSSVPSVQFEKRHFAVRPGKSDLQVVRYAPNKTEFAAGFVHVAANLWSQLIPVAARSGRMVLETSSGTNLLGHSPILVIGRTVLNRRREFQFRVVNRGNLDVSIMSMQVEPVTVFSLDVVLDTDMVRPDLSDFNVGDPEVDWDEVDVRLVDAAGQGSGAGGATGGAMGGLADTRLISGRMSRRRDRKSVFGRGTVTVAATASLFPVLLRPNQSCVIVLHVQNNELKTVTGRLKMRTMPLFGNGQESIVKVVCETLRSPTLSEKRIDFGLCDALHRHVRKTKVTNASSVPLAWQLVVRELYLTHPKVMCDLALEDNHHYPIQFVPASGFLQPGQSQMVDVSVFSNHKYCEINATAVLVTPGLPPVSFMIHALAATAALSISATTLDFGVLSVAKSKSQQLVLVNSGGLPCRFMLRCNHPAYIADPEEGVIDGEGGTMAVEVSFSPRVSGAFDASLEVLYSSTDGYLYPSLHIELCGAGGYPDLYVHTKDIDFGTAIYGNDNIQVIQVENKGDAEAQVSLTSYHPAIFLKSRDPVIPPRSMQLIPVNFRPMFVEHLSSKLFVKSSDSRSDVFLVKVTGRVGVSCLVIEPVDAFRALDFGTCLTQAMYTRTFTLKNGGNIPLSFNVVFDCATEYNPFSASIESGHAEVGDEFELVIGFKPKTMRTYTARLEIRYDHHALATTVTGTGGQMLISLLPPSKLFDFGLCRLQQTMSKEVALDNKGNYGMPFQAYVTGDVGGFRIPNSNGFCRPGEKTSISIEYTPTAMDRMHCSLVIECGTETREIELTGCGAQSKLTLVDASGATLSVPQDAPLPVIHMGIHPVGSQYQMTFKLLNEGPFGIDFFIEPFRVPELMLSPQRGYIEPGSSIMLLLVFSPQSEAQYNGMLQVLWEGKPISVSIEAAGGVGKLDVKFTSQTDMDQRCIDFGMIPVSSTLEKRFFLTNDGLVDVVLEAFLTSPEFVLGVAGEPIFCSAKDMAAAIMPATKKSAWQLASSMRQRLKPKHAVEVVIRYTARQQVASKASLCITADTIQLNMEIRGRGGTISISHRGSLIFDDVAVRHSASRKLLLVNTGSIPTLITLGWSLVRGGDSAGAMVELNETFGALDPRNGWARTQFFRENPVDADYKLTSKDYWWMVRRIVSLLDPNEEAEGKNNTRPGSVMGSTIGFSMQGLDNSQNVGKGPFGARGLGASTLSPGGGGSPAGASNQTKKAGYQVHVKRRQIFFGNVTHAPVTSQLVNSKPSYIRVDPPTCLLPGYGETEVLVDINLPTEETFLATLMAVPNVPNTPTYEISLSATPRLVSVVMDDSRPVDFGCQQLGHREVISRIFTNVGRKPFAFAIEQANRSMTVFPSRGSLDVGQSIMIQFAFEPTDESLQALSALFVPDCSQPIRIKMSGSGGRARMSLFKYKRFDFGHCMIGKETHSSLPIANEGNAILHLTKFEIIPNDSFSKGPTWPTRRISVMPGDAYQLPLVFNPHSENPTPGKLIAGNEAECYDIQLTGIGREAVLIVTKVALNFADCLIGNVYTQKVGLKNVGDVNYPVVFELDANYAGLLEFVPPKLTILPFSENAVTVIFRPTKELKVHTNLTINSPYSVNTLPVMLHSGYASLALSEEALDFGMFEKTTRPSRIFTIRNTGSVNIAYSVRQATRPQLFQISNAKDMIQVGREAQIGVTYVMSTVGHFADKLFIKTELQSVQYVIQVKGECEEALVKHEEFSLLNMGICPVLEATTKALTLTNYGKFPLKFQVKNSYPIKVNKVMGEVAGQSVEKLLVSWNPSGGYELRTQMHIVTNIGTYQVVIRGRAAFPELVLKNNYFDFGVCAVGHAYSETLELYNKGKVPLHWSIPNVRDSYSVSAMQGALGPKESREVTVTFRPTSVGRYGSSFIIESRGQNFKEVALLGVGGNLAIDIPATIDVGQCPCDHPINRTFVVTNRGDVPVHATFEPPSDATTTPASFILVSQPASVMIRPGKTVTLHLLIKATLVGPNTAALQLVTREKRYPLQIRGVGVKINLHPDALVHLALDKVHPVKSPIDIVLPHDPLDLMLFRLHHNLPSKLANILQLPRQEAQLVYYLPFFWLKNLFDLTKNKNNSNWQVPNRQFRQVPAMSSLTSTSSTSLPISRPPSLANATFIP
ncbi:hypothetical protein BC828DRAFT_423001 [Blastocladiella britannica]|nr:hypothetical protein BC828DRAFT_423001 [Blastocladiella britannica]